MEFTKENWEAAPKGAGLEYLNSWAKWYPVRLIGFMSSGNAVVELQATVRAAANTELRIVLPKRKVTVQLWQRQDGELYSAIASRESAYEFAYVLLGEHTFEIEEV